MHHCNRCDQERNSMSVSKTKVLRRRVVGRSRDSLDTSGPGRCTTRQTVLQLQHERNRFTICAEYYSSAQYHQISNHCCVDLVCYLAQPWMANQVRCKIGKAEAVALVMTASHKPQGADRLADQKLLWDKMLAHLSRQEEE